MKTPFPAIKPPRIPDEVMKVYLERGHMRGMTPLLQRKYPSLWNFVSNHRYPVGAIMQVASGCEQTRCKVCNGFTPWQKGSFATYCGDRCAYNDPEYWSNRQQAYRDKHGVDHHMQVPSVKKRVKATMIKNHGVPWAMMSSAVREKSAEVCRERYGGDSYAGSPVGAQEMREGGSHSRAQSTREKTFMKRYGVTSPLQVPEFLQKQQRSARARKSLRIGGHAFRVQGSEDVVIRYLVDHKNVDPSLIKVTAKEGVPTLWYQTTKGGQIKRRAYFPDLVIEDGEAAKIIEVKSEYTLVSGIERNYIKFKAAEEAGHDLWLAVVTRKGRSTEAVDWIHRPGQYSKKGFFREVRKLLSKRMPNHPFLTT